MKRSLKWVLGIVGAVLLMLALAAATLLFWIDPNIFRDDFERLAAKQGIVLKLDGDLSWRFFPELQIVTGNTSVASPQAPQQTIAELNELSVAVALMPLLDKQVMIRGLSVEGFKAKLRVNDQGEANWAELGKTDRGQQDDNESQDAGDNAGLDIAVAKLSLRNGSIDYHNAVSGQNLVLSELNLSGDDIRLGNEPFPVALGAVLQFSDTSQTLQATVEFEGDINAAEDFSTAEVSNGQLGLTLNQQQGGSELTLRGDTGLVMKLALPKDGPPSLPVLALNQGQLSYRSGEQEIELQSLRLDAAIMPGKGPQALALSTQLEAQLPERKITTPLSLDARIAVNAELDAVELQQMRLQAKLQEQAIVASGALQLALSPLSYNAQLKLDGIAPRKLAASLGVALPKMAGDKALSHFAASLAVAGNEEALRLSNILLQLDATEITGSGELPLQGDKPYRLTLEADVIDLDQYLPPQGSGDAAASSKPAQGKDENSKSGKGSEDIDLAALKTLQLEAQLKIGQLLASAIPFSNLQLGVSASDGTLRLRPLKGKVYDSPFSATATIDAASRPYRFEVQGDIQQLPVGQLLKDLEIDQRISGTSDANFALKAQGQNTTAITNSLNGSIDLRGKQFQFQGINVERAFCRLVAAVQREPFNAQDWPSFTTFSDTTTRITFKDGVAKVEKLDAGVSRLALSGEGKINLRDSAFDLAFTTRLTGNDAEGLSCTINNKKLLNRNIPIRCKANFDDVGATSCLPDMRVVEELAKEKIKDKVDEKAKSVIEEKLGTEKGEAAKELFKQLFQKDK